MLGICICKLTLLVFVIQIGGIAFLRLFRYSRLIILNKHNQFTGKKYQCVYITLKLCLFKNLDTVVKKILHKSRHLTYCDDNVLVLNFNGIRIFYFEIQTVYSFTYCAIVRNRRYFLFSMCSCAIPAVCRIGR